MTLPRSQRYPARSNVNTVSRAAESLEPGVGGGSTERRGSAVKAEAFTLDDARGLDLWATAHVLNRRIRHRNQGGGAVVRRLPQIPNEHTPRTGRLRLRRAWLRTPCLRMDSTATATATATARMDRSPHFCLPAAGSRRRGSDSIGPYFGVFLVGLRASPSGRRLDLLQPRVRCGVAVS